MSMDVQLLDALNNLSFSLELISEALKEGNSAKSDVAKALSGGDFFKVISEIKVGIDELKESVSEISVKQDTILELSKENSKKLDVQTDLIKKQGSVLEGIQSDIKSKRDNSPIDTSNSKNQSGIKKGIATILLIAVAVLAIGVAFKLIGGVNFLSVIALSVGIFIVALAFERIAKMNIPTKKAVETSLLMVIMAGGIMVSSWLLSLVAPMSVSQVLTSLSIAGLFYFVLPVMLNVIDSMMTPVNMTLPNGTKIKTKTLNVGKLIATAVFLPILMFTMSLGIMVASRVLSGVRVMGLGQIITSLLISGMFALAAPSMVKVIESLGANRLGFAKLFQISLILPLVLLGISFGIMLSSYVLGMVKPIGLRQAITAILIAGMFTVISFGMAKLLSAFSGVNPTKAIAAAFLIPIVFTAVSFAVMLSSWVLGLVKPISFVQFLTALAISIIFIAFAFTLKLMKDSVANIDPLKMVLLPVLFAALSFAIMLSSWALAMVKPITMPQFLTALGISAIFVVAAFAIKVIGNNLDKIDIGTIWKLPLIFTAFSLAIMLSSHILSAAADIPAGKILRLLFFSAVMALSVVLVGLAIWVIKKLGLGVTDLIKGGVAIVIIATTIMLTSLILSIGNYGNYPGLGWSIGVGASLIAFGLAAFLIGNFVTGPQAIATLAGLGAIVVIAAAVTAVSYILSVGKYDKYPGLGWAGGVALSVGGFGLAALGLGVAILATAGIGAVALAAGLGALVGIATTVVAVSYILAAGKYDKYPTASWIGGVGLAGTLFGIPAMALGVAIVGTLGLGMVALEAGLSGILMIATTIVAASYILAAGKYDKYPSAAWIASVGVAGTLFGIPAMALGVAIVGTLGLGMIALETGLTGILMIAATIVAASYILGAGKYDKYPSAAWIASVGVTGTLFGLPALALGAAILGTFGLGMIALETGLSALLLIASSITMVSYILGAGKYDKYPTASWVGSVALAGAAFGLPALALGVAILGTLGIGFIALEIGLASIVSIAKTMVEVDKILSGGSWVNGPTVKWSAGVSSALNAFMPVYEMVADSQDWFFSGPSVKDFSTAVETIASGIVSAAKTFAVGDAVWKNGPTIEWSKGVSKSIEGFLPVYKILADSQSWFFSGPSVKEFSTAIETITNGIVTAAKTFAVGDAVWKNGPTYEWSNGVSKSIDGFMPVYKMLADSSGWFFSGPSVKEFSTAIETIATGIVTAAKTFAVGDSVWKNGPTYEWSNGISKSIEGFMPIYKMLADSSGWFSSAPSVEEFSNAIETIATGIVTAAKTLAAGDVYKNGPTYKWAKGVSESIKGFMPLYKMLADSSGWFNSAPSVEEFSNAIKTISTGIVSAAKTLAVGDAYKNGPTYEWSKGVSESIKGFMPVYKMLADSKDWFSSAPSIEEFSTAIETIANGIVTAAKTLALGDIYKNGPTYEWSKSVSESIKGFMPVYKMLSDSKDWFSSAPSIEEFKDSIISISYGIKRVGTIFSNGKFDNYPKMSWSKNISYAIKSFKGLLNSTSIFDFIKISTLNKLVKSMVDTSRKLSTVKFNDSTAKNLSHMVSSMKKFVYFRNSLKYTFGKSSVDLVADDMIRISKKFGMNSKYFANNIPPDYMKNINSNISSYLKLLRMVEKSQKSGLINNKSFNNKSISNITDGIVKMAKSFDKLSKSLSKFTSSIKGINTDKLNQLNGLTTNIATLSAVDSKSLDKVLKVLESRSAALSKIIDRGDSKVGSVGKKKEGSVNSSAINSRSVKKSPELVKLGIIANLLFNLNTIFSEGSAFDDFLYKKLSESGGASTPSGQ